MSDDSFRDKLPGWIASGASAVTCTVGLSFLGTNGTLYGIALGSMASGVIQWQYERHLRKAKAVAAKVKADLHARKHPEAIHETIMMNAIAKEESDKIPRGVPWHAIITASMVSLVALLAVALFIELGTGSPVSDVVRGHHAHHAAPPTPVPTTAAPSPTFAPSTSFSPTPSATLSPSVSHSPSRSARTIVPTVTPTPSKLNPSASPTATAGATSTPTPTQNKTPAGATG